MPEVGHVPVHDVPNMLSTNCLIKKNNVIYGLFNKNCGTQNKSAVGEKIRKHDSYANYLARKVRNNNDNC